MTNRIAHLLPPTTEVSLSTRMAPCAMASNPSAWSAVPMAALAHLSAEELEETRSLYERAYAAALRETAQTGLQN